MLSPGAFAPNHSMSLSDKSEDPIEYTRKEEELHQLVEKLDIVPKEAECVSVVQLHPCGE